MYVCMCVCDCVCMRIVEMTCKGKENFLNWQLIHILSNISFFPYFFGYNLVPLGFTHPNFLSFSFNLVFH